MARVTMLAMHRDGLITLPPPRWDRGRAGPITFTQDTEPPLAPVPTTLDDVRPLSLLPVVGKTPRFTGAVYRASGRLRVGATQGRGRYDRDKLYDKPKKDIWLRPLRRHWRRTLNR